tara:strand:- start:325 stop:459 length:135 start_codon:yes stop_codon:yes gene_type:complete
MAMHLNDIGIREYIQESAKVVAMHLEVEGRRICADDIRWKERQK